MKYDEIVNFSDMFVKKAAEVSEKERAWLASNPALYQRPSHEPLSVEQMVAEIKADPLSKGNGGDTNRWRVNGIQHAISLLTTMAEERMNRNEDVSNIVRTIDMLQMILGKL